MAGINYISYLYAKRTIVNLKWASNRDLVLFIQQALSDESWVGLRPLHLTHLSWWLIVQTSHACVYVQCGWLECKHDFAHYQPDMRNHGSKENAGLCIYRVSLVLANPQYACIVSCAACTGSGIDWLKNQETGVIRSSLITAAFCLSPLSTVQTNDSPTSELKVGIMCGVLLNKMRNGVKDYLSDFTPIILSKIELCKLDASNFLYCLLSIIYSCWKTWHIVWFQFN